MQVVVIVEIFVKIVIVFEQMLVVAIINLVID